MFRQIIIVSLISILLIGSIGIAQERYTVCGRYGVSVNATGGLGGFYWPRDFIYCQNGGGSNWDLLVENWSGPNIEGYAVPGDIQMGSWTSIKQIKKIRYPYPAITVTGQDITTSDVFDEIDAKLPSDQMIETVVNSYVGVTLRQRVYAWSHPKYQDFVIVHLQLINTGNSDADPEIEWPNNSFSNLWLFMVNVFNPGLGSHDELCDRTHTKNDRQAEYSSVQILRWEGDDPNSPGTQDFSRPQILHASVGRDPLDTWAGKTVNNEGDPKPETGEFMSPMYVGSGVIHIDKSAVDRHNDLSKIRLVLWDTYYWLYHGRTESRSDLYNVSRNGLDNVRFSRDNDPDASNPLTDAQRALCSFGPWELAFNDTINVVFFSGAGGINSHLCQEKGAEWLHWWQSGEGSFDDAARAQLLRTGRDSLLNNFELAKKLWENKLVIPEGQNPQPPQNLTVDNMDSNYLRLEWQPSSTPANVVKYNIYYSEGSRDARYSLLDTVAADPQIKSYTYIFRDPKPGFAYYFNLTAVDNHGNESSLYLCQTNRLAIHPGLAKGSEIDNVRIVPNPFVMDPNAIQNYPGERDKIMIAGLPGHCNIRIYTLTGDLVDEIEHRDEFSGGIEWLTISRFRQYLASGVYIYHVQSLEGQGEKTGKFIIIR